MAFPFVEVVAFFTLNAGGAIRAIRAFSAALGARLGCLVRVEGGWAGQGTLALEFVERG